MIDQICTRRMRIVKYRGSSHGTNEYPFLIGSTGFSIFPITSVGLDYKVVAERVSSGISVLDRCWGKRIFPRLQRAYFRDSGTGKSSIAIKFAESNCKQGKKCLYFAMEESTSQIVRNMHSIGINLEPFIKKELLTIHASGRPWWGLKCTL